MAVDSKRLEHGRRMLNVGCRSFLGLGLEDGHVPTFWPYTIMGTPDTEWQEDIRNRIGT